MIGVWEDGLMEGKQCWMAKLLSRQSWLRVSGRKMCSSDPA